MATGPAIIVYHRKNNRVVPRNVNDILHIGLTSGVFVLRLIENDRTTFSNLSLGYVRSNVTEIAIQSISKLSGENLSANERDNCT